MFSKTCEYAIRAMVYIVTKTGEGLKVGIKDVAKNIGAPEAFVGKILQTLSRRGIVSSIKGPNGGFFIDEQKDLPLISIVRAIDGDDILVNCGLGIKTCSDKHPCPIHFEYADIRNRIAAMLKRNTIQDLASGIVSGHTFLQKAKDRRYK